MKEPLVFVAFNVVQKGHEFKWMQAGEVLVESLLFGLRQGSMNGTLSNTILFQDSVRD